ncbi:MAG TPA: hypothetical protein VIJ94_00210 [Caulobacteraceae bacterium]
MHLTFRAYIESVGSEDAAFSDFLSDAQRDIGLPDAESWDELKAYLKGRRATRRFMREALWAWRSFSDARFAAQYAVATEHADASKGLRTVLDCLSKASELEVRGASCGATEVGAEFIELGLRWRDLARRALRQDKWAEMNGLV